MESLAFHFWYLFRMSNVKVIEGMKVIGLGAAWVTTLAKLISNYEI